MRITLESSVFDTGNIRHNCEDSIAFDALKSSIRTLTGDKEIDSIIKFLNAFLFDICNEGITADGYIILHSNDHALQVVEHTGCTYCGYCFRCNVPQATKAVKEIYKRLDNEPSTINKQNIGAITGQILKSIVESEDKIE